MGLKNSLLSAFQPSPRKTRRCKWLVSFPNDAGGITTGTLDTKRDAESAMKAEGGQNLRRQGAA